MDLDDETLDSLIVHCRTLASVNRRHLRLGDALDRNPSMLMLYGCRPTAARVQYFAEKLKFNRSLLVLDMKMTGIGDLEVVHLASALCFNTTLTVLHLGDNFISDVGAAALAVALQRRPTRIVVMLGNNRITAVGRNSLREALANSNVSLYI